MIKKLRFKLIFASMFSLLFVLVVIIVIINVLNYQRMVSNADETLEILLDNDGEFPTSYTGKWKDELLNSPELPYESRYYYVILDEDGTAISTNVEQIAAVDQQTASEYARIIWKKGDRKGFIGDYRYAVAVSDSETQIVFLDCGRVISTMQTFRLTSIGVAAAGFLMVLLLFIIISDRIVKPFSENYEKQKRFITDAGHELKTPLAIIDADTEVLAMDVGESEWLDDIHKQTKRLADLTNRLITLSRMEEGQQNAQFLEFNISETAQKAAESFRALAKSQDKTLESDIEPDVVMRGDEKALGRLITILLDNAVKYSEPQGRIELTLQKQRTSLILNVYNTTPSIARENLPYLFDRFYRTDRSRNSQTGGYGLGLSIAASTVNVHKGKIKASTEDERSLLITVTLPTQLKGCTSTVY